MATYHGAMRTNYFRVKDEKAFRALMDRAARDDNSLVVDTLTENNCTRYMFASYSTYLWLAYDDDFDPDSVYDALMELVADDDAIILTVIEHEDLQRVDCTTIIITTDDVAYLNNWEDAVDEVRRVLKNSRYSTRRAGPLAHTSERSPLCYNIDKQTDVWC